MKKVIGTCVEEVLEFDSPAEGRAYMDDLKKAGKCFTVMWQEKVGGRWKVKIKLRKRGGKDLLLVD